MMEFAGHDTRLNRKFGWRPMTPGDLPIIGPCPALRNLNTAAGYTILGFSMTPGISRLAAELITGAEPQLDPRPCPARRFQSPRIHAQHGEVLPKSRTVIKEVSRQTRREASLVSSYLETEPVCRTAPHASDHSSPIDDRVMAASMPTAT